MAQRRPIDNQEGLALIVVLFLIVVTAIIGVAVLSTSTLDQRMAGNVRGLEQRFSSADGGVMMATTVIAETLDERQVPLAYDALVISDHTTFLNELMGVAPNDSATDNAVLTPDLATTLDGKSVGVDVDRLFAQAMAGGSLEFASGYEGIGAGAAGGGVEIYYRDNAVATDLQSIQTDVNGAYRHIVR